MTTIEDFARTICLAVWNHDYTPRDPKHPDERWAQALAAAGAVIEKHVGPMVAKAWHDGANQPKFMPTDVTTAALYAAGEILQLKGTP